MSARESHGMGSGREHNQVAFFGMITASVTHELNNVISIVEQTAGLLDDMIAGERHGVPMSIDRLAEASASIQRQTQRGLEIITRLNRFAHSTDNVATVFDVPVTVGNLVELCRRPARLKKIELELRSATTPMLVSGNPFAMQHALFASIQTAIAAADAGSTITIGSLAEPNDILVTVCYPGTVAPESDKLFSIQTLADCTGGTMTVASSPDRTQMSFRFPAARPDQEKK